MKTNMHKVNKTTNADSIQKGIEFHAHINASSIHTKDTY